MPNPETSMSATLRPWSQSLHILRTLADLSESLTLVFVVGPAGKAVKCLAQIGGLLDDRRTVLWHRVDRDGANLASALAAARDPAHSLLLAHGLELVEDGERSVLARTLNLRRDALGPYQSIVAFWIARDFLTHFRRLCPDFFHWRSLLVTLTDEELEADVVTRWRYVDQAVSRLQDRIRNPDPGGETLVEAAGRPAPLPLAAWAEKTSRGRLAGLGGREAAAAVQRLAIDRLRRARNDILEPLPIWVPLQVAGEPATAEDVAAILAACPGGDLLSPTVVESWIRHGDLFFLLDGFGDLPPERRTSWQEWIDHQRIRHPGNRFLVTISADEKLVEGWDRATVLPPRREASPSPRRDERPGMSLSLESTGLGVIQPARSSPSPERAVSFSSLLEDLEARRNDDPQARAQAARSLGRRGDTRAVSALIRALDPELEPAGSVRVSAAAALGRIKDRRAVDALARSLDPDFEVDSAVRRRAERVLAEAARATPAGIPDPVELGVGEELMASRLADEPALLDRVLEGADASGLAPTLTALARLARWRPEEERWLVRAFEGHLEELAEMALAVAVEVGEPVGRVLARFIGGASEELARRLMDRCDRNDYQRSVPLREVACEATHRHLELCRQRWPAPDEGQLEELSRMASNLGVRLHALGRLEEALEAAREAVDIRRRLAASRPDAFLPGLALSLNNLGCDLGALGRREEALEAAEEAVRTLAPFFERRPAAFAGWMRIFVSNCQQRAADAGRPVDGELLGPILARLEDSGEDG